MFLAVCLFFHCESCFSPFFFDFCLFADLVWRVVYEERGLKLDVECVWSVFLQFCAAGTSEAVLCLLQVDGYAVCLFSIDNSMFFSIFSIFSMFACLQASVDVV